MKRSWQCALSALLVGCAGTSKPTPTDGAMQFYTMREAIGGTGAPSAKELAALRPFITETLAQLLVAADSMRGVDVQRAPDEKPRYAEGDLFSSLFEAPTSCRVMPALAGSDTVLVPLACMDDRPKPTVRWTDTAVVVRNGGRWLVHDIRYGATWDFGNKGSLLQALRDTAG